MWIIKDSKNKQYNIKEKRWTKWEKKDEGEWFPSAWEERQGELCLLKPWTESTHGTQLQIKGFFEDDLEWPEIIKARIQKRKKKKHLVDSNVETKQKNKKKKKKEKGLI